MKVSNSQFPDHFRSLGGKEPSCPFRAAHQEVPWADMTAMRDKLIHGYFVIKWALVWDVITTEIPALDEQIEHLIKEIEN
jgi:uncharacterized protein with HEPN domain